MVAMANWNKCYYGENINDERFIEIDTECTSWVAFCSRHAGISILE